jgi:hypothetical protein
MFPEFSMVQFKPFVEMFLPQLWLSGCGDEAGQISGWPGHHTLLEVNHLHGCNFAIITRLEEDVVAPEVAMGNHDKFSAVRAATFANLCN